MGMNIDICKHPKNNNNNYNDFFKKLHDHNVRQPLHTHIILLTTKIELRDNNIKILLFKKINLI